jgi:hypothetical protein
LQINPKNQFEEENYIRIKNISSIFLGNKNQICVKNTEFDWLGGTFERKTNSKKSIFGGNNDEEFNQS